MSRLADPSQPSCGCDGETLSRRTPDLRLAAHGFSSPDGNVLDPVPDQWVFLASVKRLDPGVVHRLATEADRRGRVVGVRAIDTSDGRDHAPWRRPPSGRGRPSSIEGPLPSVVHAVLAQRLYVRTNGLPPSLLNEIKRLAAFQNPEFYRKQRMRLSTAGTPRVISCSEDTDEHVSLPRGCRTELEALLRTPGVDVALEDRRFAGGPAAYEFDGRLTSLQESAARALLAHDSGVVVGPPGIGKTVPGTYAVARRGCSTLVLVHRQPLLAQWAAQLAMFLGIQAKDVRQIGGGGRKPNGRLDVAMLQSPVRRGEVLDTVADYGHVIVDECHHIPAFSFESVLSEVKARYLLGLTATPERRDGLHPTVEMQLGPIRFRADPRASDDRVLERRLVVRETSFQPHRSDATPSIQRLYGELATDSARNEMLLDDIIRSIDQGRSPIVLTERRDHLDFLAARLKSFVRHLVVLRGGMKASERRERAAQLAEIPVDEERLVLATGRYVGEGFDDPRLDTLFLALPVSWKATLIQYAGRLNRLQPGKSGVCIFDYVDREVPMLLRMFERRLRTYRAIGYQAHELSGQLGF